MKKKSAPKKAPHVVVTDMDGHERTFDADQVLAGELGHYVLCRDGNEVAWLNKYRVASVEVVS